MLFPGGTSDHDALAVLRVGRDRGVGDGSGGDDAGTVAVTSLIAECRRPRVGAVLSLKHSSSSCVRCREGWSWAYWLLLLLLVLLPGGAGAGVKRGGVCLVC